MDGAFEGMDSSLSNPTPCPRSTLNGGGCAGWTSCPKWRTLLTGALYGISGLDNPYVIYSLIPDESPEMLWFEDSFVLGLSWHGLGFSISML